MKKLIGFQIKSKASKQVMAEGQHVYVCPHGFVLSSLYIELLEKHGLSIEDHYVLVTGCWDCSERMF